MTKWRAMAFSIVGFASFACGGKSTPSKDDPNTPAVVKAPLPVLAIDTMKKEVPPVVSDEDVRNMLARNYALLSTTISMGDGKTAMSEYAPAAEFTTSNGTFVGTDAIGKEMNRLTTGRSIKEFSRVSYKFRLVDSTVVDSGSYMIVSSRPKGESREKGQYATTWKIQAAPLEWVMLKDHLYPPAAQKAK